VVDENATHRKRVRTMKEHLAGIHAGVLWSQDVVANHLEHLSEVYDAVGRESQPQPPVQEGS
jgi:hypothetical protein